MRKPINSASRARNGWYTRGSRSFAPHCEGLFLVSSLRVCGTLNQGNQVDVWSCLTPILIFAYNCLSRVTIYPTCTFVYHNVYPHVILTIQSSAVNVLSLSDFYTWKFFFFKHLVFLSCISKWLLREKDCFGTLKIMFCFWSGSCLRCFQRLHFLCCLLVETNPYQ